MPRLTRPPAVPIFLLPLFLLPCARASTVDTACSLRATFPHDAVPNQPFGSPTRARVPIVLYFACDAGGRAVGRGRGLVVLVQGAFVLGSEYARLGAALARRGFVVAVPDYASRDVSKLFNGNRRLQMVFERAKKNGCPRILPFPSAAEVVSVLEYMQSTMVRCDIRATYTVRRTVFLVHSAGGAAVEGLLSGACATVSKPATEPIEDEELGLRLSCEQARAVPKGVKVLGVVSYEGHNMGTPLLVRQGVRYVAITSRFYLDATSAAFGEASYNKRLATVVLSRANHFGPTEFSNARQQSRCAALRLGAESAFRTQRGQQNRVIRSVARVTLAAARAFEREDLRPLKQLVRKRKLVVQRVTVQ